MQDDKFEKFKVLYKKFVDGTRWLNRQMEQGADITKDKGEFEKLIVQPMDVLWQTFTAEEKDYWDKVNYAVKLFNGKVVG